MGIFGGNKKEKEAPKKDAPKKEAAEKKVVSVTGVQPETILLKPHVSEKSFLMGVKNVYVFMVHQNANVGDVAKAVQEAYGVTPIDVRIAKLPGKKTSRRMAGRPGKRSARKKAYVQLKEGDKIALA